MEAVYGINAVRILLAGVHTPLKKIIIANGRGGASVREIIDEARSKNIPLEWKERAYLDRLAGGTDHQGVAALREPFRYAGLDDVLKNRSPGFSTDFIVILDSILDPHNLGSIIRTSHCLGANGIILPADRAAQVTSAVIKVSAGSAAQLPIACVTNLARVIDELKEKGFWVFGADAHEGGSIRQHDFRTSTALILGGEAKGMRRLIRKKCDFLVTIPMTRGFDSLNVAVAAGIIQYEILLQRIAKNDDN